MRTSSVSSEEFEPVDFEDLAPRMISHLSSSSPNPSLSTMPSVVGDVSIPQDSPCRPTSANESNPSSNPPLEAIDSFLPMLQLLPGLELIGNAYYYRGVVSKGDVQKLYTYARTIGEFTLTDTGKGKEFSIHPGTLLRLQHFHSRFAIGPLLPSLNRLRIVGGKSSLDHLNLFLTPSLRSLEMINVEEAQQISVSVFLDNLLEEVATLSQITLGPGRVVQDLLQTCLKFNHLSRLEIFDAISSFDFSFLEKIGTLRQLETLILNARTSLYHQTAPPAIQLNPLMDNRPNELCDVIRPSSPQAPSVFDNKLLEPPSDWGFLGHPTAVTERKSFSTSASRPASPCPSELMHDKYSRAPSPTANEKSEINDISAGPSSETAAPKSPEPKAKPETQESFLHLTKLHIVGSLALIEDLVSLVPSEGIKDLALTLVWTPSPSIQPASAKKHPSVGLKKKATKLEPQKIVTTHDQPNFTELFLNVVDSACSKWSKSLTALAVSIGREDSESQPSSSSNIDTPSPVLPTPIFESLLFHRFLEKLEIGGWTLTDISESIQKLVAQVAPSKLKVLHLPIDKMSPGISLSRLRLIAEACPELVSLRCNIKHMSNVPEYPSRMPASNVLSHGLEVLSVGNPSVHPDPQRLLLIARHLNVLFPYLKTIETHPGHNAEQWKYIGDLVELCQNASLDETMRSSA